MLVELGCDKFSKKVTDGGFVQFRNGLNIVLGGAHADNSVGKTTFLMAIDFAFGAKSYAKDDSGIRDNIGEQVIKFAHKFDDEVFYFSRNTSTLKDVNICDKEYKILKIISIDEFTSLLTKKYKTNNLNISFRSLISGFFRIYGKDNYYPTKPLRAFANDKAQNGIEKLLKLFGLYDDIKSSLDKFEKIQHKQQAFKSALQYNFINGTVKKSDYERNKQKIAELNNEINNFEQNYKLSEVSANVVKSKQLQILELEKIRYERLLCTYKSQLAMIKAEKDFDSRVIKQDFADLLSFFPNTHIKKLTDIENFHKELNQILANQFSSEHDMLINIIQRIYEKIQDINIKINELNELKTIPSVILNQYVSLVKEKAKLEKDNNIYTSKQALENIVKTSRIANENFSKKCLNDLEEKINQKLSIANNYVCQGEKNPPILKLNSLTQYDYNIPKDTGTGSQTRALCLFDLVILNNTVLPAFVHDSNFLKQIEDKEMLMLMELYNSTNKQVFIAIDKMDSYDDNDVSSNIRKAVVLELSKNNELYGMAWNKN